jgi:hypothetical protein
VNGDDPGKIGSRLEDLFQDVLESFLPFDGITYERRANASGDVDFLIHNNGKLILAYELKNWKCDVTDQRIKTEIQPRYENTPNYVAKILVGSLVFTEKQKERYLHHNHILFHKLLVQVPLLDEETSIQESKEIEELVSLTKSQILYLVANNILIQTGKYRRDHLSKLGVVIVGDEIRVEDPTGHHAPKSFRLKTKKHLYKKKNGMLHSETYSIGPKPLDAISWIYYSDGLSILFLPKAFEVYSDSVQIQIVETDHQEIDKYYERMRKSRPEWKNWTREELEMKIEELGHGFLRRSGITNTEFDPVQELKDLKDLHDYYYGNDLNFTGFLKAVYWWSR